MSSNDDEYNGFYIPKGTILIANAWLVRLLNPIFCSEFLIWPRSILNDRKAFNNPEEFQPERYLKDGKLNPDVRDPHCAAFGFGRRSVNTTYPPKSQETRVKLVWLYKLVQNCTSLYKLIQVLLRFSDEHTCSLILPQCLSWKTPKWQLVILNCILCSRGIWHQTTSWRSGEHHQAQTWVHCWIIDVNIFNRICK